MSLTISDCTKLGKNYIILLSKSWIFISLCPIFFIKTNQLHLEEKDIENSWYLLNKPLGVTGIKFGKLLECLNIHINMSASFDSCYFLCPLSLN